MVLTNEPTSALRDSAVANLDEPLVVVGIPAFNEEKTIARVILEAEKHVRIVVVCDDGSTDNSQNIIASYLSDGRIRYIYQKNRGFSATINRGIAESNGCLIGFIGQDDLWMPNKLDLQVKHFSKHKEVALVHSNFYFIDSENQIIGTVNPKVPAFPSRQKLIKQLFLDNFIGFETVLVKRKCFDRFGLFDERMVGFSDHDMWLRIVGCFDIGYLNIALVKKRQHGLQLSKNLEIVLKDEFLLVDKAIKYYPFLKTDERRKLASLYYTWGIMLLHKGNIKEAKPKLHKVIRCQPWKLKAVVAYITPYLYVFILRHYQGFAQMHTGLSWIEG